MLLIVLIVLVVLSLGGGGWGHSQGWGVTSWSPLAVVLLILAVLYFSGHLHG